MLLMTHQQKNIEGMIINNEVVKETIRKVEEDNIEEMNIKSKKVAINGVIEDKETMKNSYKLFINIA